MIICGKFKRRGCVLIGLIHWAALQVVAATPSSENGRKLFATCAACHAPNQVTSTGPDLRGVFGRKSGSVPGFRYSRALKNTKFIWDEVRLDAYLAEPQVAVPGNAMPFPGLPKATERQDLIAYLKTVK